MKVDDEENKAKPKVNKLLPCETVTGLSYKLSFAEVCPSLVRKLAEGLSDLSCLHIGKQDNDYGTNDE